MEAEFLTIIGTVIGSFLATMGIMVAMFMNLGNKIDAGLCALRTEMGPKIDNFQAEMRDLHGRVAKIEAKIQR
jgi:hypothetical protein